MISTKAMPNLTTGNTHLVAGSSDRIPDVLKIVAAEGISIHDNPDLYVRTYRHFGIDEARELCSRASLRSLRRGKGQRRVFVIAAPDMTREAQNALLKTLEEPPANALFVFLIPAPDTLLPTLRSRSQMLVLDAKKSANGAVDAGAFVAASVQKRLDMLKPLLEKGEDEKRDLGAILAFLSSLERVCSKDARKEPAGLRAVYRARKYLTDKGALVKPLLEQVALLVPKV